MNKTKIIILTLIFFLIPTLADDDQLYKKVERLVYNKSLSDAVYVINNYSASKKVPDNYLYISNRLFYNGHKILDILYLLEAGIRFCVSRRSKTNYEKEFFNKRIRSMCITSCEYTWLFFKNNENISNDLLKKNTKILEYAMNSCDDKTIKEEYFYILYLTGIDNIMNKKYKKAKMFFLNCYNSMLGSADKEKLSYYSILNTVCDYAINSKNPVYLNYINRKIIEIESNNIFFDTVNVIINKINK